MSYTNVRQKIIGNPKYLSYFFIKHYDKTSVCPR